MNPTPEDREHLTACVGEQAVREMEDMDLLVATLLTDLPPRDHFAQHYMDKAASAITALRADLACAKAQHAEQFRLYCEETKKHNETAGELAKVREHMDWCAERLTEHAEAVGVNPEHINYIDLTTKKIIETWAQNGELKARAEKAEAENARLREALGKIVSAYAEPITDPFPPDWSEQIAKCPECQGWCKTHPLMNGICDTHRRPLYEREKREKQAYNMLPYTMRMIATKALAAAPANDGGGR